jgi:hypothetical protein
MFWMARFWNLAGALRFFSLLPHLEWVWGPSDLHSNNYWGSCAWDYWARGKPLVSI